VGVAELIQLRVKRVVATSLTCLYDTADTCNATIADTCDAFCETRSKRSVEVYKGRNLELQT
jgi:hypothetical protein